MEKTEIKIGSKVFFLNSDGLADSSVVVGVIMIEGRVFTSGGFETIPEGKTKVVYSLAAGENSTVEMNFNKVFTSLEELKDSVFSGMEGGK